MKDQRPCLVQRVMEHFRDATSVGRVSQRVWDLAYTDCPRHTHRHINVPPILTMGQAWAQSTCPELSAQGLVPLRWGCAREPKHTR